QVVIGAGATGVILQVLRAVTSPGEKIVMTSPTFDGYPIFAQMARLESVTVALDAHGHHDLDAMADPAAGAPGGGGGRPRGARPSRRGGPPAQPDGHLRARRRARALPAAGSVGHGGAVGRGVRGVLVAGVSDRCTCAGRALPECRGAAYLLEGLWAGRPADRLRLLRPDPGSPAVDDATTVRHRHHQSGRGGRLVRRGKPAATTHSDDRCRAAVPADA